MLQAKLEKEALGLLSNGSAMAAGLIATFPLALRATGFIFGDRCFTRGSETDEYLCVFHDCACMTPQLRYRKAFVAHSKLMPSTRKGSAALIKALHQPLGQTTGHQIGHVCRSADNQGSLSD
jgi:hypothetical protein